MRKKNYRWPFQHMSQSHPSAAPISLQGRCSILHQIYRIGSSGFLFFIIIVSMKLSLKSVWCQCCCCCCLWEMFTQLEASKRELILTRGNIKNIFSSTSAIIPRRPNKIWPILRKKAAPSNIDCVLCTFLKITCTSLLWSDYYTNKKTLAFLCLTISSQI